MSFLSKGKEVEAEFARTLHLPTFSTKKQDIEDHWDVSDNYGRTYDVKSAKKRRRHDPEPDQDHHWIELRNVRGDLGWLYGQADSIVFEHRDCWIVVDRHLLVNELPKFNWVERRTRRGRKDLIVLIETVDLIIIAERIVDKL